MKKLERIYCIVNFFSPDTTLSSPPFAVYFSSLPSPLFLFLYSETRPSPFFSVSVMLYTFFFASPSVSTSWTLYSCSPLSPYFHWSKSLEHFSRLSGKKWNVYSHSLTFLKCYTHKLLCLCCKDFLYVSPSELHCTLLHFPLWPHLLLFSSASLFLSSLCRWRSRWLARVRELDTLIFIWSATFLCLRLFLLSLSPSLQLFTHSSLSSPQGK